jgi:gas vesicle protein GvpL/GvpF
VTSARQASPESRRRASPGPSATYVYCVARSARAPSLGSAPAGLPGTGRLRALPAGQGLWLIVADAPLPQYGEAGLARVVRDLDAVSRCAVAHSAIVAHCAGRTPVLPLRLLTLFASDERALARVRGRRAAIARRLDRLAGRAEWGVQARLAAGGGPTARRARAAARRETARLGPGTRFLELRRRQRETARDLASGAKAAAAVLYRALARHADASRQRPLVSMDGRPALLLDAAFLVPATGAPQFRRAVQAQTARAADRGLQIRLTGPWPPYSFVAGRL